MAITSVEAIVNGITVPLTAGDDGAWSATTAAPSQTSGSNNSGQGPGVGANAAGKGYYSITIKVTDDSGNVTTVTDTDGTWGTILRLKVLEKTAPTCQISYPSAGAYLNTAQPTIKWTMTDSGSGINPATCYISVDSGAAVQVTPEIDGATASFSYAPTEALSEGQHTIEVYGSDYDGNASQHVSVTFTIDTVPPVLNVTSPAADGKVNTTSLTVTGTTNDVTSSPVTVTVKVGAQTYNPTVGTDGSFSQAVTLAEGANVITVTATDKAGKTTTVTRNVTVDSSPPEIVSIEVTPNPVDGGATLTIKVTATDA